VTGVLVAAAVVILVLVLGVVAGLLLRRDTPGSATAAPATSSPLLTSAPAADRPAPTVPGWQVAISSKRKLAYDVPADWKVIDEEAIIGFEDASGPKVGMTGAATYLEGYCSEANAWRAGAGFSGYRDTDLSLVATDAAGKWARYGYLGPNGELPRVDVAAPEPITVNGISGAYASARVQVTVADSCAPPSAKVHAVALPAPDGCYVFVIFSDQEVPQAISDELARKIIATIRWY
jgi:hypothetical protein